MEAPGKVLLSDDNFVIYHQEGIPSGVHGQLNVDDELKKNEQQSVNCWGCKYGFGTRATKKTEKLAEIYREYRDKTTFDDLCLKLSESHFEIFVKPYELSAKPPEPWTVDVVKTHLEWHMIDRRLRDVKRLKKMHVLEDALYNAGIHTTEFNAKDVNPRTTQFLIQVTKLAREIERDLL